MGALLTFIQEKVDFSSFIPTMIEILSGANPTCKLAHRAKTCLDMVAHQPSSLQHSLQRKDFEGGVHLGIGGLNSMLSLLPAKIIKLLEWVGFPGDKVTLSGSFRPRMLRDQNLRSPMCAMVLLAYHSVITITLFITSLKYSSGMLKGWINSFKRAGAIFLYYAGRLKQVQGKLDEATKSYNDSIAVQSEWKQFHHICYWELMWCYSNEGDWATAYHYASVLLKESR
ncbi:unnamed protein product [Pocillopora meandrina]|uniref:Uncharacterized protein n=1 Tax=Pocillopora meandrina TaxID=46732 RepID=A0AAU9WJ38_9CNID|nr:unnamed protein product [Pocillopora meandrina]